MTSSYKIRMLGVHLCLLTVLMSILLVGGHHPTFVVFLSAMTFASTSLYFAGKRLEQRRLHFHVLHLLFLLPAFFALTMLVPLPIAWRQPLLPESASIIGQSLNSLISMSPPSFFSLSLDPPQTALRFLQLIGAALLFAVFYDALQSKRLKKQLSFSFLALSIAVLLVPILHRVLGMTKIWGFYTTNASPVFGPLVNPNHQSKVFGIISLVLLAYSFSTKNKTKQYWYALFAVVSGALVFLTLSRGGIVAYMGALLLVAAYGIFFGSNNRNTSKGSHNIQVLLTVSLLLLPLGLAFVLGADRIWGEISTLGNGIGEDIKWTLYAPALQLVKSYWLVGAGPGSLSVAFFNGVSANPDASALLSGQYRIPFFENFVLQTFFDHGIFKGLALFLGFGFIFINSLSRSWPLTLRQFTLCAAVGMVFIGDLVDFAIETSAVLFLLAFVLAYLASGLPASSHTSFRISKWPKSVAWGSTLALILGVLCSYQVYFYGRRNLDQQIKLKTASVKDMEKAIFAHPLDSHYTLALATRYLNFNQTNRALFWLDHTIAIQPNKANAHLYKARTHGTKNLLRKSISAYQAAWSSNPSLGNKIVDEVAKLTKDIRLRLLALPTFQPRFFEVHCRQLDKEEAFIHAQLCFERLAIMHGATMHQKLLSVSYPLNKLGSPATAIDRLEQLHKEQTYGPRAALLYVRASLQLFGVEDAIFKAETLLKTLENKTGLLRWLSRQYASGQQIDNFASTIQTLKQSSSSSTDLESILDLEISGLQRLGNIPKALSVLYERNKIARPSPSRLHHQFNLEMESEYTEKASHTLRRLETLYPESPNIPKMRERSEKLRKTKKLKLLLRGLET